VTSSKTGAGTDSARRGPSQASIPTVAEARVPGPAPEPARETLSPGDLRSTPDLARPHRRSRPPRVRLRLPDGQHLDVTLVSWHQYRDGTWRARVSWPVWGAVAHAGEVQTRTCAQQAYVPARMLTPIAGEDYRAVRRHRPRITVPRQG
jgi:hypothetical protein